MLDLLAKTIRLLAKHPGATAEQIAELKVRFASLPEEYVRLIEEATEIELQHENGQYVRIWGPRGCIEMDEGYEISKRINSAIPIGDDGGGQVIFYMKGKRRDGLYHVGYGNLDADDAVFTAPSLVELLQHAVGMNSF